MGEIVITELEIGNEDEPISTQAIGGLGCVGLGLGCVGIGGICLGAGGLCGILC